MRIVLKKKRAIENQREYTLGYRTGYEGGRADPPGWWTLLFRPMAYREYWYGYWDGADAASSEDYYTPD